MPVHRYMGRYPRATGDLYRLGLLRQMPVQKIVTLFRDYGVNITYRLKGCTPERFRRISHLLLEAAEAECGRYPEFRWKFARFEVQLNRTAKGRRSLPLTQTYTAGKHVEADIMVWGVPGGVPGEVTNFLIDKVEQIIDIPTRYIGRVKKQRPYTVLELEICLRAGMEPPVLREEESDKELPEGKYPTGAAYLSKKKEMEQRRIEGAGEAS